MKDSNLPLVLYGAGNYAVEIISNIKEKGLNPTCFCDSDTTKHGIEYLGFDVLSLEQIKEKYKKFDVYITPITLKFIYEIVSFLLSQGIENENIINLPDDYREKNSLIETNNIKVYAYSISYYIIEGWAYCPNNPTEKIKVTLHDINGKCLTTTFADMKDKKFTLYDKINDEKHYFLFRGYLGNVSYIEFLLNETQYKVPVFYSQPEIPKFSLIHPNDYLFEFYMVARQGNIEVAVNDYINSGEDNAKKFKSLILEFLPDKKKSIDLLEFACGYGRVTRHLDKSVFNITASDIHEEAIDFIKEQYSVHTLLSKINPKDFTTVNKYDTIIIISLFSHLPDKTFGDWLAAIYNCLRENGILIFTTHGRVTNNKFFNMDLKDGYGFQADSEQRDLAKEDYGSTISELPYVLNKLIEKTKQYPIYFHEAGWYHQDVYIVKKTC